MSDSPLLIRYFKPGERARLGVLRGETVHDISHCFPALANVFRDSVGDVDGLIAGVSRAADDSALRFPASDLDNPPAADAPHWLPPLDEQEVWAAGVTYLDSRRARQEEAADGGDVYARVYTAERPEIFFKASSKNTVGHLDAAGFRADSSWNVPEPELALVVNPAMEMLGFTIGNDMSSRDIEGRQSALSAASESLYRLLRARSWHSAGAVAGMAGYHHPPGHQPRRRRCLQRLRSPPTRSSALFPN